jgi:hypothetical protein
MMVPPGTHTNLAVLHFEKHSILFRKSSFCAQASLDYFPQGPAKSVTCHNNDKRESETEDYSLFNTTEDRQT